MENKIIIITALLLLVGCTPPTPELFCNQKYLFRDVRQCVSECQTDICKSDCTVKFKKLHCILMDDDE